MNKPTKEQLQAFVQKYSWSNQMNASNGLDGWSNYGGPDLGHVVVVVSRTRDSDILSESNFECALEQLGGESETVVVLRFGHWACGWFELLCVNPSDATALLTAYEIKTSLNEYPVLDDSDHSEREYESYSEYAEQAKDDIANGLEYQFGLEEVPGLRKALIELAYRLNMDVQFNSGGDGCLDIYKSREPDENDLFRLLGALKDAAYSYNDDSLELALIRYFQACIGED